jgi:hypothetical protein
MNGRTTLLNTLITGGIASLATTVAASLFSKAEGKSAARPINAVSHIAWGEEATHRSEPSVKYTLTGALLNTAAVMSWGLVQEVLLGRFARKKSVPKALAAGAAVSGLAYVTDYHVVPKRLTPGFEDTLNKKSLAGIYAVLAVSLALGAMLANRED